MMEKMTNDEIQREIRNPNSRNPKEIRMPKPEFRTRPSEFSCSRRLSESGFREFGMRPSFVIRHSEFVVAMTEA